MKTLKGKIGLLTLIAAAATAMGAGHGPQGAALGQRQISTGDFPPQAQPYLLQNPADILPYRLELTLSGTPSSTTWEIRVESGGRKMVIDSSSLPAADGTFLTPQLEVAGATVIVPVGAPAIHVALKIVGRDFGRSLSVYPDNPGDPPFVAVAGIIAAGGHGAISGSRLERAARGMSWLGIEDKATGSFEGCTGFLVTPDLLMTARHCLSSSPNADTASTRVARAWVRELSTSRELAPTFDRVEVVWSGESNDPSGNILDATLLRLPRLLQKDYVLKLSNSPSQKGQQLQILQFPGHAELSLAANNRCNVTAITPSFLLHKCNTDPGSSGSPVFHADLQNGVVGVHIEGYMYDPTEESKAIPMDAILNAIKAARPALYNEIIQAQGGP